MSKELYLATNNGDIGGGEVMLLNIARAARGLGYQVVIIGPANPPDLIEGPPMKGSHASYCPPKRACSIWFSCGSGTGRTGMRSCGVTGWFLPPLPGDGQGASCTYISCRRVPTLN